jgi:hypothetical protein
MHVHIYIQYLDNPEPQARQEMARPRTPHHHPGALEEGHTYIYEYINLHEHTHTHTHTHTNTHTHTQTHTHTHTTQTHKNTHEHTDRQTHTHIRRHTHTHTALSMHTYIHVYQPRSLLLRDARARAHAPPPRTWPALAGAQRWALALPFVPPGQ